MAGLDSRWPRGQHANKTSSKVEVRFDVAASPSLGPRQLNRLLERLGPVVRASSSQDRSQARNRQIALDRLAERVAAALRLEAPRRPTRPTAGSKTRRLDAKRRRGDDQGSSEPGRSTSTTEVPSAQSSPVCARAIWPLDPTHCGPELRGSCILHRGTRLLGMPG